MTKRAGATSPGESRNGQENKRQGARQKNIHPDTSSQLRNGEEKGTAGDNSIHFELIENTGISLFGDEYGVEYVRVPVNDHAETHRLHSKWFRNWLIRYYLRQGAVISQRAVREWIGTLAALAGDEQRVLANRSLWSADRKTLRIDLGDSAWRVVQVSSNGWSIEANPPSCFRRFVHQLPLPEPDASGNILDLFGYLPPLPTEGDRLLLAAWVVCALVPMPRPILALIGPHGSAKSTVSGFLRRLLDPSKVELLGKDARADLPLIFLKHAVPAFDNLDSITPSESDLFCQGMSGRGIDRRKLYTDADDFIFAFQRAIMINGLRLPTNRPDFLDRVLAIELERLAPEQRQVLERVEEKFMQARPQLLGGLLNTLSLALAKLPDVSSEGLSRMADFHRMGRAVAVALGFTATQFDEGFRVAEARQKRGAFENTLALTLLLFVRKFRRWEGNPTELFQRLHETARANQIRQSPEFWPDTPMGLGRQIKHLADALAKHGVQVTRPRRAKDRSIVLEYDAAADSVGDED
jgi:hypothetical protein